MLSSVLGEEFVCRLFDRFPLLVASFFFENLAVALLQPLTLAALFVDSLRLVCGARGTAMSTAVEHKFVMIEATVFEDAQLELCGWVTAPARTSSPSSLRCVEQSRRSSSGPAHTTC